MDLIIGGYSQNKLEYAKSVYPKDSLIVNDFHLRVKEKLRLGKTSDQIYEEAEAQIKDVQNQGKQIIFICDETGCGVVPVDAFEREWREVTGRILCKLAKKAERVVRIVMGLPQVIKG